MGETHNKFQLIYKQISKDPLLMIKRPYLLFLLPLFIFLFIQKRWHTNAETIYLTETSINDHTLLNKRLDKSNEIVWYKDFNTTEALIIKRIAEEVSFESYIEEVKKRFELGDYMVALLVNSKPASYAFLSKTQAYYPQVKHRDNLSKDCFAIYDVYTLKDFRGKGYYEILLGAILREMRLQNYTKFWLWVMKHNQVSVKVHEKLLINHVICIYTDYYRYGIRRFNKQCVNFFLKDLIEI